jgi:hypothetical protein
LHLHKKQAPSQEALWQNKTTNWHFLIQFLTLNKRKPKSFFFLLTIQYLKEENIDLATYGFGAGEGS